MPKPLHLVVLDHLMRSDSSLFMKTWDTFDLESFTAAKHPFLNLRVMIHENGPITPYYQEKIDEMKQVCTVDLVSTPPAETHMNASLWAAQASILGMIVDGDHKRPLNLLLPKRINTTARLSRKKNKETNCGRIEKREEEILAAKLKFFAKQIGIDREKIRTQITAALLTLQNIENFMFLASAEMKSLGWMLANVAKGSTANKKNWYGLYSAGKHSGQLYLVRPGFKPKWDFLGNGCPALIDTVNEVFLDQLFGRFEWLYSCADAAEDDLVKLKKNDPKRYRLVEAQYHVLSNGMIKYKKPVDALSLQSIRRSISVIQTEKVA